METGPGVTSVMNICALGGSVATPNAGLKANVVEVTSLEELDALGSKNIKGKELKSFPSQYIHKYCIHIWFKMVAKILYTQNHDRVEKKYVRYSEKWEM